MNGPIPNRENLERERRTRIDPLPGVARREGRERAGCEDAGDAATQPRDAAGGGRFARSLLAARDRLHRVKGSRPAKPRALAALDPAAAEDNANGSGTTDENAQGLR